MKNPTGKDQVVGAMMQVDLKQNPAEELVLIPVNGANIPQDIESQLNKIYEGTGGKFKIRIAPNYQSPITSLVCGESGFMANYTEEQNAFVKTYQSQNQTFDDTKRYVFIMKDITPSRPLSGFMPLGRQVGFVFTGGDKGEESKQGNIAITLAHELGHGVYQIQHPWEQLNTQKTELSTNSWLMSYGQGIQLPYIHWEQISHPKFIIPIFKSDASGELAGAGNTSDKNKKPKQGDCLLEMKVVNSDDNSSAGLYGCARSGKKNCIKYENVEGYVSYGMDKDKFHDGYDIKADLNTPIFAMYDGIIFNVVSKFSPGEKNPNKEKDSFGNMIIIKSTSKQHKKGDFDVYIWYTHLNEIVEDIRGGKRKEIKQGDLLGKTGNTGNAANIESYRYHTHIKTTKNGTETKQSLDGNIFFGTKVK